MQAQIKMIAHPHIDQPRQIDARAIYTFYIQDRIVLQKTLIVRKIEMRFVVANVDPKMIRLVIMAFLVDDITQLCHRRS